MMAKYRIIKIRRNMAFSCKQVVSVEKLCYTLSMDKRWKTITASAFALIVAAVFIWRTLSAEQTLSALICGGAMTVLFIAVGVALCMRPFEAIEAAALSPDDMLGPRSLRRARRHPWAEIALFVLLSRAVVLIAAYILYSYGKTYPGGLWDTLEDVWTRSDSASYLGIAERWYVTEGDPRFHIVFFPLYPCVIWLFNLALNNTFVSAMAVSAVMSIIAGIFIYEAAAVDMQREAALRSVKYAFAMPAAFFMAAPMTEALFIMLSAAAIYFTRRKKYLIACVLAALSGFTRSVGGLMIVFIAWEITEDFISAYKNSTLKEDKRRLVLNALCLLLVPLGLIGYLYINYSVTGDPFTFMRYQKEHWSQGFGFFFEAAETQLNAAVSAAKRGESALLWGLWIPNLLASFAALILMRMGAKKLRPSYTAYFLAYFVVACGATWLLSAPRYLTACLPLTFSIAANTDERKYDIAVTAVCILLQLAYLGMYVNGLYVY